MNVSIRSAHARQPPLGMRLASFLGALALATGVFFLFREVRAYFSTAAQVATLLACALGSLGLTVAVARRDATGYFTRLAALVAFACFVLDIAMLGAIFAITPSDTALLAWAAYAFVLAYAYDLRLLQVTGILVLMAFIAARTGTWGGMSWLDFGERPENFFPAAIALFAVPAVADQSRFTGFAATYRVFGLLGLFLPMGVLANRGTLSHLAFDRDAVQHMYQVLGFAGTASCVWLGARRRWKEVSDTGGVLFVMFLCAKLFDWWWGWMPKVVFFPLLGLAALLLLFVFKRLRGVLA